MNSLSIIIVNWNTTDYLLKCLQSIYDALPSVGLEIVVVDNDSAEDVLSIRQTFPAVRIIKNSYNYGFGVATNIGVLASESQYVMTLNPDTVLDPGMIDALIETLDGDEQVGVAVPVLRDRQVLRSQYSFSTLFFNSVAARKVRTMFGQGETEMKNRPFDVNFIGGTGYVCRRSALAGGRMFVEDNFLFGEEFYLCREMAARSLGIRVVPSARFQHHTSVTFKNDPGRLTMASKLGAALGSRIRRAYWGRLAGLLTGSVILVESVVKWTLINLRRAAGKELKIDEIRMLDQCRSHISSFLPLIFYESKYIDSVNRAAEIYFNNGKRPERPPVFEEIDRRELSSKA